ncbi:MAG: hypothetical protein V7K64_11405 [Nostoc sp.]|uniref:hypothetical protein n=1 Tax=Nostoc sp. TaxID=1180 RepID=UPI002FF3D7CC
MHKTWLDLVMNPLECLIYLLISIEPQKSMTGREYAIALLLSKSVNLCETVLPNEIISGYCNQLANNQSDFLSGVN